MKRTTFSEAAERLASCRPWSGPSEPVNVWQLWMPYLMVWVGWGLQQLASAVMN